MVRLYCVLVLFRLVCRWLLLKIGRFSVGFRKVKVELFLSSWLILLDIILLSVVRFRLG